jgi:hypothetical protein
MSAAVVPTRRDLHFVHLDQVVSDAEAMAIAQKTGKLHEIGNWTLGQICGHLAAWMDYSFDGAPIKMAPWPIRMVVRVVMKNRMIHKPMRPGAKIPGVPGGTAGTEVLPTDEGLERLRKAVARLQSSVPAAPHPLLGPLTHDQWKQLTLRHSELHLSFLHAD